MSRGISLAAMSIVFFGLTAQTLLAEDAKPVRVAGQLTKIDGKALTIAGDDGKDVTITCNDATKLRQDGGNASVTLDAFKVGQKVRAYYRSADNVAIAVIIAQPGNAAGGNPPGNTKAVRLVGQLTKIDGKTVTITSQADGKSIALTCTDATKYRQDGSTAPVTFDAFKVGQTVRVYYNSADNTIAAMILTKAP